MITAASAVKYGGVLESLALMSFGNQVGARVELADFETSLTGQLGGFVFTSQEDIPDAVKIGQTTTDFTLVVNGVNLSGQDLQVAFEGKLEEVYPTEFEQATELQDVPAVTSSAVIKAKETVEVPVVYIPVFPGTNSEYDSAKAFEQAGAKVNLVPFVTLDAESIENSVDTMVDNIAKANILFFAGGFSAADEPDGSAKFIVTILRNAKVRSAIDQFIEKEASSSVSVMVSRPLSNRACCRMETLRRRVIPVQPSSTTMPTNTLLKWWKRGLPMSTHRGWQVSKSATFTLSQFPTVKENL